MCFSHQTEHYSKAWIIAFWTRMRSPWFLLKDWFSRRRLLIDTIDFRKSPVYAYYEVSTNIASQWNSDIKRSGFFVSAENRQDVVVQPFDFNFSRFDKNEKLFRMSVHLRLKHFVRLWLNCCDFIRFSWNASQFF